MNKIVGHVRRFEISSSELVSNLYQNCLALYFEFYDLRNELELLNAFDFYECTVLDGDVEVLPYASETAFDTLCGAEQLPDREGHSASLFGMIDVGPC